MTSEQFQNLKIGDIILPADGHRKYAVIAHFGPQVRLAPVLEAAQCRHWSMATPAATFPQQPCDECGGTGGNRSQNSGSTPHHCKACDGTGVAK
jgi:hypothetical protein